MKIKDFDFDLPSELIAQHPAEGRDGSRLMVVDRATQTIRHSYFRDLPSHLREEDLCVLNNTKVIPARLFGYKEGGQTRIEVLLLRELEPQVWEALVRPGRRAPVGSRIIFSAGALEAEVGEASDPMKRTLRFRVEGNFWDWIQRIGKIPLPPYIRREEGDFSEEDRERYQTVYAKEARSVAAPTAGLHFTERVLAQVPHCEITLHVGYGTFRPVSVETVEDHRMDSEFYSVDPESATRIQRQKEAGRRIVVVGTTTTRTLEHVYREKGRIEANSGWTDLFIYPGFQFQVAGAMITNFHLPASTLLLLVSAFAGTDLIRNAYAEAIRLRYRFYSYGDSMLIL